MAAIDWYKSEVMSIIDQIGRDAFMEYMMNNTPRDLNSLPKLKYGSTPTIKETTMRKSNDAFEKARIAMNRSIHNHKRVIFPNPDGSYTFLDAGPVHIDIKRKVVNKRKPKEAQPMKHTTVLKFWLETTRQVLTGIPNKVAGGYPRDLHFGVEPKDVDFFVRYNEKTVNEILSRLKQLNLPHHDCIDDIEDEEGYPSDETEDRISRVIKVGEYIDIIFVNHALTKVTDNFDFNINQFELGMMDDPVFTGKTHNNVLQVVTDTSFYNKKEELSSARIAKIVKKADSLGWVCSQEVLDIVAKI